ncbi:pre-mrna splicing factor atp-dependent rna helicase prp43 [Fusarium pseudoanthophilum]|uniref:RNA helicase n=1 Tax=Fusarium pseudoanthophilum TaxID=48495 RepID=A0A8H5KQZ7_9HYPO|nr:pre-mrna splicing factor atp-dependent rna helicase prp43 [Fusarium pseudoanthophilum]
MDEETTEEIMYMTVLGCELAKPNPLRPGVNRSPSYFETLKQCCHLPIMQKEGFYRFLQLYNDSQVVVVDPESSADSIQLTKRVMYLELFKDLQVLCTQPDNVATRELGQRVAAELDVTYGEQVGVQYRKYNKTSDKTRLRFVTEGMLLQLIGDNPTMAGYSCLVLDFYEPTSNVDRLLPLLKKAIGLRCDIQVVILSTKYFEKFALYFDVPHGLTIGGTSFPVGVQHVTKVVADYCETACHTVNQIHQNESPGDILVFLATDIHVDRVVAKLRGAIPDMETFPLYGKLSKAEKAKALRSGDKSRCVITTNFAESSITVEGIVYVVGFNSIGTFNFLDPAKEEVYLRGIKDVNAMNLIDEVGIITPAGKVAATLPIDLTWYNAFNEAIKLGCLSELIDIAALASVKNPIFLRPHKTQHAADSPHGQFTAPLSDHMTELNTLHAYLRTKRNMSTQELATWCNETFLSSEALEEALVLQEDLIEWCKARLGVSEISVLTPDDKDYDVKIRKAITKGFFLHAAIRDDSDQPDQYRTLKEGSHVWIHPNSALGGGDWEWVVYHKIEPTGFQYMDRCTVIEPMWLLENDYFYPLPLTKDYGGKFWLKPLRAIIDAIDSSVPHRIGG